MNIASRLRQMAQQRPYQRAVVAPISRDSAGRVTYSHHTFQQLDQESDRIAASFKKIGIARGMRTVMMVRPGLDFFAVTFALFKSGAIPVVVDPGMGLGRMIRCLQETAPQAFIGIPMAHVVRKLFPGRFKSVSHTVTVGRRWFWGGHSLSSLSEAAWQPFQMLETKTDDTAAILFTTGSTGPAKGVLYTHGVFDAQIRQIRRHFGIEPGEVDLPTFPLFALFDPALGMTAVIPDMDPTRPAHVKPERILEPIFDHGVTNMFASPALLHRVGLYGKNAGIKLPSLRRVVSAGAPVSPANIEQFSTMLTGDAEVHTPYGATEAVPVTSIGSRVILSETKPLSEQGYGNCVGQPLTDIDLCIIRISDSPISHWSDDLLVSDSEIGEIVVKGDLVTRKYYRRPKADMISKIPGTDCIRHRMGDLGWQDKKGRIWYCGRKDHRVKTQQGELYTIPCEAIFNQHPQVFRSALVGVGPKENQKPVICIEPVSGKRKPNVKLLRKELTQLAQQHPLTQGIDTILFHKSFPVDIRHNAKIFREKLAVWAARKVRIKKT
ncbi:MAG: AMP-binding protein [Deltaproteobacteria bacterium]|nr:AMP-binding protein [Deltaproteobacteria bacterium]